MTDSISDDNFDLETRMEEMQVSQDVKDFLRLAHAACAAENHAQAAYHPGRAGFEQDDMTMAALCRPTPRKTQPGDSP